MEQDTSRRGKYIVFEGGEHTGKSTQVEILAHRLGGIATREPGGTRVGGHIRALLLDPKVSTEPKTEIFLFAADRAQHIIEVVQPTLESGVSVVSDRSWISSAAYQARGDITIDFVRTVNELAIGNYMQADLVILLDSDPQELVHRRTGAPDYFEQKDIDFHNRVRENFLTISHEVGAHVIDAMQDREEVSRIVWDLAQEIA